MTALTWDALMENFSTPPPSVEVNIEKWWFKSVSWRVGLGWSVLVKYLLRTFLQASKEMLVGRIFNWRRGTLSNCWNILTNKITTSSILGCGIISRSKFMHDATWKCPRDKWAFKHQTSFWRENMTVLFTPLRVLAKMSGSNNSLLAEVSLDEANMRERSLLSLIFASSWETSARREW